MKVYKLTDQNMRTYGDCQWEVGKWKKTSGKGRLCSDGWLHCYSDPLIAVLLNPINANFNPFRLFIAEAEGRGSYDSGLKSGYKAMRLIKEIEAPSVTERQRIAFAILCAKQVYKDARWEAWADKWLSGKDRTANAAYAAAANANDADAADAAAYAMRIKILKYGIRLLEGERVR